MTRLPDRNDLYLVDAAWTRNYPLLTDAQVAGVIRLIAWPGRLAELQVLPPPRRGRILTLLAENGVFMGKEVPPELNLGAGI